MAFRFDLSAKESKITSVIKNESNPAEVMIILHQSKGACLMATTTIVVESVISKPTTKAVVEQVKRFAEVKAEITRLDKIKAGLTAEITKAFGTAELLTHHGVEVARLDERSRANFDKAGFVASVESAFAHNPEMLEIVMALVEQNEGSTDYKVIVNLYR